MIDNICQKLTETHSKQNTSHQEVYNLRLLAVKMALFCCSSVGHQKAMECHTKLVLMSIYAVFKGLLRPKNVPFTDMVSYVNSIHYPGKHCRGALIVLINLVGMHSLSW